MAWPSAHHSDAFDRETSLKGFLVAAHSRLASLKESRRTSTVDAVRELDAVIEACGKHTTWVETALEQCPLPPLRSEEGEQALKQIATTLSLEDIKYLIATLSHTLDLLETHNSGLHKEGLLADLLNEDIQLAFERGRTRILRLTTAFNGTVHSDLLANRVVAASAALWFRRYDSRAGLVLGVIVFFLYGLSTYGTDLYAKETMETVNWHWSYAPVLQGVVPAAALLVTLLEAKIQRIRFRFGIATISLLAGVGNLISLYGLSNSRVDCLLIGRVLVGFSSPLIAFYRFLLSCVRGDTQAFWWFIFSASGMVGLIVSFPLALLCTVPPFLVLSGMWVLPFIIAVAALPEPSEGFVNVEGLAGLSPFETTAWSPSLVSSALFTSKATLEAFLTAAPIVLTSLFQWEVSTAAWFLAGNISLGLAFHLLTHSVTSTPSTILKSALTCLLGSILMLHILRPSDYPRFWVAAAFVCVAGPMCEQSAFGCSTAESARKRGSWVLVACAQAAGLTVGNLLALLCFSFQKAAWSNLLFLPTALFSVLLLCAVLIRAAHSHGQELQG